MESPPQPGEEAAGDVSRLLRAWSEGDPGAFQQLTQIIYGELRRVTPRYMPPERPRLPLIFLVHEAYMCLVEYKRLQWQDRALFFAVSAQLIRRLLVNQVRRHNLQRGGGVPPVSPGEAAVVHQDRAALIELDDAVNALARIAAREARVVEMRLFGRLSFAETAEVLQVSPYTVMRHWHTAKAWLYWSKQNRVLNGSK